MGSQIPQGLRGAARAPPSGSTAAAREAPPGPVTHFRLRRGAAGGGGECGAARGGGGALAGGRGCGGDAAPASGAGEGGGPCLSRVPASGLMTEYVPSRGRRGVDCCPSRRAPRRVCSGMCGAARGGILGVKRIVARSRLTCRRGAGLLPTGISSPDCVSRLVTGSVGAQNQQSPAQSPGAEAARLLEGTVSGAGSSKVTWPSARAGGVTVTRG